MSKLNRTISTLVGVALFALSWKFAVVASVGGAGVPVPWYVVMSFVSAVGGLILTLAVWLEI